MRCAIYARVSSSAQRDAGTIAAQLEALPRYAEAQGWEVVGRYIDDGQSAKAGNLEARRGLTRALADAGEAFDVLLVWDVDRLTRSEDLTERGAILGAFQRAGVRIASPATGMLDVDTSQGDLHLSLKAAFAADWLRGHRARVKAGKARAIAQGGKPAGPTPYGYRYDRLIKAWSIHEPEADIVREVCRRVASGESMETIALDLNRREIPRPKQAEWRRETLWDYIRRRTYYADGRWLANKAKGLAVAVPTIVEPDLWQAAQAALDAYGQRGRRTPRRGIYLLQGLAECASCGSPIRILTANGKGNYVCRRHLRPRWGETKCEASGYVRATKLDALLWDEVCDWLASPGLVRDIAKRRSAAADSEAIAWRADIDAARRALARLEQHERAVLGRMRRGLISQSAGDSELAQVARERRAHERQSQTASKALQCSQGAAGAADRLAAAADELKALAPRLEPMDRQRVVRALVGDDVVKLGRETLEGRICLTAAAFSSNITTTYSLSVRKLLKVAIR